MAVAKSRVALLLGLSFTLAASQLGCASEMEDEETSETSEAVTSHRIVVRGLGSAGPAISKWGYDIKQDGRSKALRPALAKEIFGEIGMNLLRIPVRAIDAHPSRGVANIKRAAYAEDIDAIKTAKAVRPDLDVFASLKLLGDHTFPGWVKEGGDIDADAYSALLQNFLAFMKDNGVTIDWLGVDNERKWNEGNITPAKYNRIVSNVKQWCRDNGVKVPGFIAAEDYGPNEDTGWLQDLWQSPAKFTHVDHVGVHTYTKHRNAAYVDALQRLANVDHGKGLWDSELHWNDLDDDGVHFDDVKPGILAAMDHFDLGFRAMTWWAFQPRSNGTKSSAIMSDLVSSTIGARPIPTDDMDGRAVAMNKFNSRAFLNDAKHVTLWVANYDDKDKKTLPAEISNQEIASATYVQWSSGSPNGGKTGNASLSAKNGSVFSITYPANTITRVAVTLK